MRNVLLSRSMSNRIRSSLYKKFDHLDLKYFQNILPPDSVITDNLDTYNIDWLRKYKGNSPLVLKPKTNEQVASILKYCNNKSLAIVPQGGNTGLVGGSVPVFDEIIINMSKMDKIASHDEVSNSLYCESGCILENLNNFLEERGYTMPIDLGAKGSCLIGGNVATNAGGIHFVKHGSLRKNVKGLKVYLADGTMLDCINPLPKNNTGYDLKQLFIGSEGTLGIITECLIHTPAKCKVNDLVMIACNRFEDILKIYQDVKEKLPDVLSAIEFFDREALLIQQKHGHTSPLDNKYPFYLIIETASNKEPEENRRLLEEFITDSSISELIKDGVIAQDENQKKKIWHLRETIQGGASKEGIVLSYDVSIPLQYFYKVVEETRSKVGHKAKVIGYGHIGDYNLHLNVCYNKFEKDENFYHIEELMEPFIYDHIANYKGSISAEHGIGVQKADYLNRTQTISNIEVMKLIKDTLDPKGILNPYKLFK